MYKDRIKSITIIKLLIMIIILEASIKEYAWLKASELERIPLAIGFGENERFVLYSDGEILKLLADGETINIGKINFTEKDVEKTGESSIKDFEIYGRFLYLYIYRSLNSSSGETIISIFDVKTGEKIWEKKFPFLITEEDQVIGNLILSASACEKGIAFLKANTTHSIIEVYKEESGSFKLAAIYGGRMAMSLYRYNGSLLAATYKIEFRNGTPWITPRITDLMENRTLFELPALIPVAAFAYPFIQVFNRNGSWECYVSVYQPTMGTMEYYIVYPERLGLIESGKKTVSPYMEYSITDLPSGSRITFRNGENITLSQRLSLMPQGVYVPLNPINCSLDADPEKRAILAKIVQDDKAKIVYIKENSIKEIYFMNASFASKTSGFYAALIQDTVYIINPKNNELLSIRLGTIDEGDNNDGNEPPIILIFIVITVAIIISIASLFIYHKRRIKKSL